jgi:hypothetical protein
MKLKGTAKAFNTWITIRDYACNQLEIHPDSMGSQTDVRFWIPYLTDKQAVHIIKAMGWSNLLEDCDSSFSVLTDMLDTVRLEAGLKGYYIAEDWL